MKENIGAKIAKKVVVDRLYVNRQGKQPRNVSEDLIPEEIEFVSVRGALMDLCGGFTRTVPDGSDVLKRNLRLLSVLPKAIKVYSCITDTLKDTNPSAAENRYPVSVEIYKELIQILIGSRVVDETASYYQIDNEKRIADLVDEIYVNTLPAGFEICAVALLKVQDGELGGITITSSGDILG